MPASMLAAGVPRPLVARVAGLRMTDPLPGSPPLGCP